IERLERHMQHHARVLADRVEHHRIGELGSDLAHDLDRLGLEPLQMSGEHAGQAAIGRGTSEPLAMNHVLRNPGLPYASGVPSGAMTAPPAATSTACPAAVSHSMVVPRRG